MAIVPASFFLAGSLDAAINVPVKATAAEAFKPFLLWLVPSLALYALGAYMLDAAIATVALLTVAGIVAVLWAMTLAFSSRPR